MKTEDLDRLVHEALADQARGVRFDGWRPEVASRPRRGFPSRARRIAVLAVAAAVVAAGIAVPLALLSGLRRHPPPPARVTQTPADLWGRSFVSQAITENGVPRPLVPETRLEVVFRRTSIGWEAGCNSSGGDLEATEDHLLVSNVVSTLIGCPDDLAQQDSWLSRFFVSDPSWMLEGDRLTLMSDDTVIELQEQGAQTTTYADGDDGIAITVPASWTFREDPAPLVAEPRTLLGVGTWAFPIGGACEPFAALRDLPDDGAFVWLIEYRGSHGPESAFIPRPDHFEFGDRYGRDYTCSGIQPAYQIRFTDEGRYFQLEIAFGPNAPDSVRTETLRALDSIEVTAPVPEECPADTGPWSDPNCPEQAWVRAVIDDAGYEIIGDTGSALVARAPDTGFYVWANREERLATEPTSRQAIAAEGYEPWERVGTTEVFTDGIRAAWTVQGMHCWIEGGPVDDLPPIAAIAPVVRASERVDYDAIDTR
jgi:heat shock protein HslJ